jgi:hypothetical protein
MKRILYYLTIVMIFITLSSASSCNDSDDKQQVLQEKILEEIFAKCGMPAIKNAREKLLVKDILERRDQYGLVTYTYIFSQMQGKFTYIGESVGYAIPYATQYTNPMKQNGSYGPIPQADPNGLFSPASAEGSWIVMYDPVQKEALPQYFEERLTVVTYKLPARLVIGGYEEEKE